MKRRKESLLMLNDIINTLKTRGANQKTISDLQEATAFLSEHIIDALVENIKQKNKEA